MKKLIPILFSFVFIFFVTYKDVGLLDDTPSYKMLRVHDVFVTEKGMVILSNTSLTHSNLVKVGTPDCDFEYTAIPLQKIVKIIYKPGDVDQNLLLNPSE